MTAFLPALLLGACKPEVPEEPMWSQEVTPSANFPRPDHVDANGKKSDTKASASKKSKKKKGKEEGEDSDCESSSEVSESDEDESDVTTETDGNSSSKKDKDTTSEADKSDPSDEYKACNVAIEGISLNQSLETRLSDKGQELPIGGLKRKWIVTSKESLVRVYLGAKNLPSPKELKVWLTVESPGETWKKSQELEISGSSRADHPASTANFIVPERMIGEKSRYRVSIRQSKPCMAAAGDRPDLPKNGTWEIGARAAKKVPLSLIRVNLPGHPAPEIDGDLMERIHQEAKARYPIAGIEYVSVSIPVMYAKAGVSSNSKRAWERLIKEIKEFAYEEFGLDKHHVLAYARIPGVKDEFAVSDTPKTPEFSASILNLVDDSSDSVVERSLHALGHLHGLTHDDCDDGGNPKGYIREWGYSGVSGQWLEPEVYHDVMCRETKGWVHRQNYVRFGERVEALL